MNDEFTTVSSSTQVEIEKEGEIKVIPFKSGVTSDHIVTVSLESTGLSGVTPQYIKAQLIANINSGEQYMAENPTVETEYSFQLNFGLIRLGYRRKITKRE